MADNAVMMSLAKVIVAAAWADGQIDNDEINSLKDLLFFMPGMTASDWAQIDIYTHSPVGEAERDRLVGELEEKLKTQEDKEFVLQALDALLAADGAAGTGELEAVEARSRPASRKSGLARGAGLSTGVRRSAARLFRPPQTASADGRFYE